MQTAEECRQACLDLEGCVGFTFVKSEMYRDNCAVKWKWDPSIKTTNNECCDSGRVTKPCRNPSNETCEDGIQNQDETNTDCGGVCPACETCEDGIQNQDETDTDCGGVCTACETCEDGI